MRLDAHVVRMFAVAEGIIDVRFIVVVVMVVGMGGVVDQADAA